MITPALTDPRSAKTLPICPPGFAASIDQRFPRLTLLFSLFALAAMNVAANAQGTVSGTSVTVTGDSDVLNLDPNLGNADTVFAESVAQIWNTNTGYGWNPPQAPNSLTANGVTFTNNGAPNPWVQNGVTLSISNFADLDTGADAGVTGNMQNILWGDVMVCDNDEGGDNAGNYDPPGNNSITFSGLTSGQAYTLQIFAGQSFEGDNELVTDVTNGGTSSGTLSYQNNDAYILDAFTAPANGTETIDLTELPITGSWFMPGTDISAVNLQLGTPTAVPEPATWGMMLSGVGMLIGLQRMRRRPRD